MSNRFNRFNPEAYTEEEILAATIDAKALSPSKYRPIILNKVKLKRKSGHRNNSNKSYKENSNYQQQMNDYNNGDYSTDGKIALLEAKKQIKSQYQPDSRYYNPDGSKKSVADISVGFAKDEAASRAYSEKNKMMNFAKFSDYLMRSRPDKNGFIKLNQEAAGRLPAIAEGFTGINNPKDLKVRFENGRMQIYGDGKPLNVITPRADVVQEFARIGSVFNDNELRNFAAATGAAGPNPPSGKLNDRDKETVKIAQKEIEYNRKKLDDLKFSGANQNDPEVQKAARNLIAAENAIKSIIQPPQQQQSGRNYNFDALDYGANVNGSNNAAQQQGSVNYDDIISQRQQQQQVSENVPRGGMRNPPSLLGTIKDAVIPESMRGSGLDEEQLQQMNPENRAALLDYLNRR